MLRIAGNHDYCGNVESQIEYSKRPNTRWTFPDYNHRVVKEFVVNNGALASESSVETKMMKLEIIMIDTVQIDGYVSCDESMSNKSYFYNPSLKDNPQICADSRSDPVHVDSAQASATLSWIEDTLIKSDADYLLVTGHYPIYSACTQGNTNSLIQHLDPLLRKYGVTAYLSGHDHCQSHFQYDGMDYIITGIGDGCCYAADNAKYLPVDGDLKYILADTFVYAGDSGVRGGFASFSLDDKEMIIYVHNQDGDVLYETKLSPRVAEFKSTAIGVGISVE